MLSLRGFDPELRHNLPSTRQNLPSEYSIVRPSGLIPQQLLKIIPRLICADFFLGWRDEHALGQLKPFAVIREMLLLFWIGAAVATLVGHGGIVARAVEADFKVCAAIARFRATGRGAIFVFCAALPTMSCRNAHAGDSTTVCKFAKLSLAVRKDYTHGMNICVLDGFTLNPGDLSWDELRQLGSCEIHDRTPSSETTIRTADAEIVLTNKTPLTRETLGALPKLKYIGVLATGTNVVDLVAARERNIVVTNVPAYGSRSVAQATIAMLLELTNHVGHHAHRVRDGGWTRAKDWCFWDAPLVELDGLTLGVVGFGRIGASVADIAHALGMKIIAYSPSQKTASAFVTFVDLETIFRSSDVVSLHCPLTPQTQQLVNAERLRWMKPSALLLNTSRGPLVDEAALADALNAGRIAGAALDVLSVEPPPVTNPLLSVKNCLITPHNAWGTRAARLRLMSIAVENVRAFIAGKPQNVVN